MKKICKICGKEFETKYPQQQICNDVHTRKCVVCGKEFVLPRTQNGYKKVTCSQKCKAQYVADKCKKEGKYKKRSEKSKQTCLKKYGVEHPLQNPDILEKSKSTLEEHYGVDNPMKSEGLKEKAKQTNFEKYGVDNVSKSPKVVQSIKDSFKEKYNSDNAMHVEEFSEKQKDTMKERYGVEHPLQNPDIIDKMKSTNLERYGYENVLEVPEIQKRIKENRYENTGYYNPASNPEVMKKVSKTCQERYGVPYACMRDEARCHKAISSWNKEFADKLEDLKIDYELEFHLEKYSYDIKVNNNLIEIDSTIFHNSYINIYEKDSGGKDKNYHLDKTKCANKYGYRCIHIFDWDDWNKIFSLLTSKESIYARNCKIKNVSKSDCDYFLNKFHLQNTCKGQKYIYGLYYNDELVELMSFGKPRYNKNYQYELLRLCTDSRYTVIGGASKLFKYFIEEVDPESVISYCDISKFNGGVYTQIGMNYLNQTSPNKIWSKNNERITNNYLMSQGYDRIFKTNYGKGTSNETLMLEHGWLPVYDCGQYVYSYIKD